MSRVFDFADALASLRPGAEWSLAGSRYEGISWHDQNTTLPTEEELLAEVARLQAEYDSAEYQRQRINAYPPLSQLADALYWQAQGNTEPMTTYLAACAAVKQQFPKP